MPTMRLLPFILLLVFLGGCRTPPIDLTRLDVDTPLSGRAPIAVRIDPSALSRIDQAQWGPNLFQFRTGQLFAKWFPSVNSTSPKLSIVESHLSADIQNLGFTAQVDYEVTIRLETATGQSELKADGTYRYSGFDTPQKATRIAVETAIASLYDQINPLIE